LGKVVVIGLFVVCLLGGVGIWYTQTRAFWAPVEGAVSLAVDGAPLAVTEVEAIASTSSPLGFRACFRHAVDPAALPDPRPDAVPTVPPGWFDCFDAGEIAGLMASGEAVAFTAYENAAYGVDRIVALAADGRGWAWHELNECGRKSYDGTAIGDACPDRAIWRPLTEGAV
jgi:hypothetical protein